MNSEKYLSNNAKAADQYVSGFLLLKDKNHGEAVHIIHSKGMAYHQQVLLHIIKLQAYARYRVMICRPKGRMICTALRAVVIYQACGLDKKTSKPRFGCFLVIHRG